MNGKCAIREVTKDVWTFSCPFARFGLFPVGGRSTAVKLPDGNIWVLASTPLTDETKEKLGEIGTVKWIVAANAVHFLYLGEFKKQYPDAKLIATQEVVQKMAKENLMFDGVWSSDSTEPKYGFEDHIQHCFFSGSKNKDVTFLHPASKTMIEADLLLNLPATEQYSRTGWSGKIPLIGDLTPYMWVHRKFAWSMGVDKEAMRRDVKTVAGWDFERIIPCHGDVIEKDGNKAWREAYKWYLQ